MIVIEVKREKSKQIFLKYTIKTKSGRYESRTSWIHFAIKIC